jgi:hypothetical protein
MFFASGGNVQTGVEPGGHRRFVSEIRWRAIAVPNYCARPLGPKRVADGRVRRDSTDSTRITRSAMRKARAGACW